MHDGESRGLIVPGRTDAWMIWQEGVDRITKNNLGGPGCRKKRVSKW